MLDIASPIVEWLNTNPKLAGLVTFLISATESIAIVGTIVPGSIMMTTIGALVGTGIIPLWSTLIAAILGAIVGDGISYWLGYYFKDSIYDIWPFKKYPKILQNGEAYFRRHGSMSVFIGRFVGPVRALVPMVAGMFGMRPLIFTIANVLSAIGWAPAYMMPGFLLGIASLELPSELTGHLVLTFLLWLLFAFFCFWFLRKSIYLVHNTINRFLNWVWNLLKNSRFFYLLIIILKHHNPKKNHGQLTMGFYLILVLILFFWLAIDILLQGPSHLLMNKIGFYLFRSLRSPNTDNIFLYITFLGDKLVLLPLIVTLFLWFSYKKHWRMAWHTLALGVLTAGSIEFFKDIIHSVRPWGTLNIHDGFSFPSGHSTLSFVFYIGMALLFIRICRIKSYRPLLLISAALVAIVGMSRLYFGVHWVTDIIGSWLLGSAILIVIVMSYYRKADNEIKPLGVFFTIFLTLTVTYTFKIHHAFNTTKQDYTKIEWPIYTITENSWWLQQGNHLPLYRINRFGIKTKIFNIQWLGNLPDITHVLLKNGWQIPSPTDWLSMLYRLSSVESTAHLPLVLPLYLDKPPVLVLTKLLNNKQLLILRFWNSNIVVQNTRTPLWVGIVEIAPSTYSWLSVKKRFPEASLQPSWVFSSLPNPYIMEVTGIKVKINHHYSKTIPMMLIKSNIKKTE